MKYKEYIEPDTSINETLSNILSKNSDIDINLSNLLSKGSGMKDNEIKEILELLKEDLYIPQEDNREYKLLDKGDDKLLLDYITNLQEDNHRLKELCDKYEEEHSTTFEYWKNQLETNKHPTLLQGKDKAIDQLEK